MHPSSVAVREHYEAAIENREALLARVGTAVDEMGASLTAARLARLDQFHMGGLAATVELANRVAPTSAMRVLDAGSGLGGPARYLAETFGCHVTGIDLAPAYVAIATLLTERAGLVDRVTFQTGDLTELSLADATFDLVWTQHVAINIADRDRLYRELHRVMRSDGRFAFFDPISGDNGEAPYYPVPWATTAADSTLLTRRQTIDALVRAGFRVTRLDDVTADAIDWATNQVPPASAPSFSAADIVGTRMLGMAGNFMRSLKEGRVRLVMGICHAA